MKLKMPGRNSALSVVNANVRGYGELGRLLRVESGKSRIKSRSSAAMMFN